MPTVRDCTPTVGDDPDLWDVAFDGSGRSGRFGPLRFGPLEPSDEALLRLLLSKREVGRRDVAAVLRRPSEHISGGGRRRPSAAASPVGGGEDRSGRGLGVPLPSAAEGMIRTRCASVPALRPPGRRRKQREGRHRGGLGPLRPHRGAARRDDRGPEPAGRGRDHSGRLAGPV